MITSRSCKDGSQHCLSIAEDVIVPETEDAVSGLGQGSRPFRIGCSVDHVLGAIKLNDEPALGTDEVHNVGADRMLTSELEIPESAISQMPPDQLLCIGRALP